MILHVYPPRGVVIGNSSVDSMGNQLPSHARLFTLLVPVNIPMIYNATLHLLMEKEDGTIVSDKIIFSIKRKLLSILQYFIRFRQPPNPFTPTPRL